MGVTAEIAPLPAVVAPTVRRRRIWIFALLGLGIVAAAAGALTLLGRSHTPVGPRFETMAVTRGPLQARVTANGTLSALVTVQVGSQVSGRIQRLDVDFNAPVKKGQVIAQIDPLLFRATLEQARANVVAARGNLEKARAQALDAGRQFARARYLRDRNLNAQAEVDTAEATAHADEAAVAAARGVLAQTQAALHQAQVNLDYTTIVSPIDGVVVSRNVDVGQTVAATFQSPTLFLIAEDLRKMQVDTSVAEADVGRLADGMPATFTVDAYPSRIFAGLIRQVRKNPQTVQNVVTYDAVIDVRNEDLKLFPGMTANVMVVYADRADVVQVPNAAVRYRMPPDLAKEHRPARVAMDQRLVWILRAGVPTPAPVRLGVSDGSSTEVVDGPLSPGDRVITEAITGPRASGPGSFGRVF